MKAWRQSGTLTPTLSRKREREPYSLSPVLGEKVGVRGLTQTRRSPQPPELN